MILDSFLRNLSHFQGDALTLVTQLIWPCCSRCLRPSWCKYVALEHGFAVAKVAITGFGWSLQALQSGTPQTGCPNASLFACSTVLLTLAVTRFFPD